jgi:hypothetical protein
MSLRTARRLGAVALAVALPVSLAPATQADHANPPGPVNAQTTYDWGKPAWQDDFVGPRKNVHQTNPNLYLTPGLARQDSEI